MAEETWTPPAPDTLVEEWTAPSPDSLVEQPAKGKAKPISPALQAAYESGGFEPGPLAGEQRLKAGTPFGASFIPPTPDIKAKTLPGMMLAAPINVAKGFVEGAASPVGIAAPTLGPLAGPAFGIPAIKQGLQRVYRGAALADPQEAMEGALQTITGGLITSGGVRGAARNLRQPSAPTVAETTPLVPKEELPTTPTQTGLRPAIRLISGKVVVGDAGETHPDIFRKYNITPDKMDQRGFVNEKGEFVSREKAAVETQLPTQKEPGRLHSTDLPEATEPAPKQTTESQQPKGIAASIRNKWTSATEEGPTTGESGFINIDPIKDLVDKATPYVKGAFQFLRDLEQEQLSIGKMNDYRRSVLGWSQRLQTSFQEAANAQKDITKRVTNEVRREGITNWIQADGDPVVLQSRLVATKDNKLRKGYEAALNLTPDEIAVANDVKNAYATLGNRGSNYGVLGSFKDNYVTQIWNLRKGPVMAGARTLRDRFRFSKASAFPTFFDGEQAGFVPKTKDISKLLPVYLHEMNQVIAARQLVADMSQGVASDGRPLVAPRGKGIPVQGTQGKATLIIPKAVKEGTEDYRVLPNQPALTDWRWTAKDDAGNPIFLKGDLALHPEAYQRLKNVLGKSAIAEWFQSQGSVAAKIPKLLVQGLDAANSETKRTMLGLLAPFHQVQEATHAIGHRVNPTFGIPKVDLINDIGQKDAAAHGLMLQPDRASANQFMEGFRVSGLISKIPGIGPVADFYSNYLFHQYIPGLKYKTYDAILGRNQKLYAAEISRGEVTLADIKHLSAEQANAAFGHLNYTDLARNPTVLHFMRLGLLAPDFLEARARFAGQALKSITGAKVGREQILALGFLALAQAATAYTAAGLTGGTWDKNKPFEFHVGNRRFSMRSVPQDLSDLAHNTRTFIHSRISPIIGKGALQYIEGVDWRGQRVTAGETTKQLLEQPLPISIRGFLGLGRSGISGSEQLLSSAGLRISRYSPSSEVFDLAKDWMSKSADPKVRARLEFNQKAVFPDSVYKPLRLALQENRKEDAQTAYQELLKTHTRNQIETALKHPHPFTGSKASEESFRRSLTPEQQRVYREAIDERTKTYNEFLRLTQ